jgi:hypothetical protein
LKFHALGARGTLLHRRHGGGAAAVELCSVDYCNVELKAKLMYLLHVIVACRAPVAVRLETKVGLRMVRLKYQFTYVYVGTV